MPNEKPLLNHNDEKIAYMHVKAPLIMQNVSFESFVFKTKG